MDWFTVGVLKYRRLVARHGPRLAAGLALAGLLVLAGGAATLASPPTDRVTETVQKGHVDTSVTTEAVVTGESRFYDRGTVLQDRPLYVRDAAPALTVTAGATVEGMDTATVEQSLVLVYAAEVGDEQFWTRRETLATDEGAGDGETVSATLNTSAVHDRLESYRRELGGEGTVTVSLRHEVRYRTDDGATTVSDAAPLTFGRRTYALGDGLDSSHDVTRERTHLVPDEDESVVVTVAGSTVVLSETGLGGLAAAVVLLAVAWDALARHRRGVDITAVERRLARTQFEEWVSRGQVPADVGTDRVPVASLGDLVDVAIDCDARVVHDRGREVHAVIDGQVVYYYGTVPEWEASNSDFRFVSEEDLEP